LGLDDETFGPLAVDLDQVHHLVVAGPPGAGKTSLLATCLLTSLATPRGRQARWYLASPRDSALAELRALPNCARMVGDVAELGELLGELETEVAARRERARSGDGRRARGNGRAGSAGRRRGHNGLHESSGETPILLVLDDYDVLRQDDELDEVETQLIALAKRGRLAGLHVLVAGFNVELRRFNNQFAQQIAQTGAGALLQPDLEADGDLFGGLRLRRFSQADPPPGRGYFVLRQQTRLFQAATCEVEGGTLREGVCHWVASAAVASPATAS
jgi:hypothetical protein